MDADEGCMITLFKLGILVGIIVVIFVVLPLVGALLLGLTIVGGAGGGISTLYNYVQALREAHKDQE